jgi:hypothetical protein
MDNETHWFPLEFITAIHGANLDAESLPQSSPVPSPGQEEAAAFSEAEQPDDSASEVEGWLLALDSQGHEKKPKRPQPPFMIFLMILGGPKTELPIAQMKSKKATVVGTLKEHGLKTGTCSMKRQASQHEQMLSNQRLMHIGIIWDNYHPSDPCSARVVLACCGTEVAMSSRVLGGLWAVEDLVI